jgi:hypothetical protein
VHVHPATRELGVHRRLWRVLVQGDPIVVQAVALVQAGQAHAEDVDRGDGREAGQQVAAGRAPAAHRLVDDDGGPLQLAGVALARVDDAVLDDGRRCPAVVVEELVEVRDVGDRDVAAVGQRMPGVRHRPVARFQPRGIVLEEDRRQVAAGFTAQPLLHEVQVTHPLQDDDVGLLLAQLCGRHLAGGGRPVPGARATEAVGVAARRHRQQVVVVALDERRRPGTVHVPDQDLHRSTSFPTAATTSSAVTEVRHG